MRQAAPSPFCSDRPSFSTLMGKTAGAVLEIGPQFVHYGRKLNDLAVRSSEGRFHLAVLGQFKRGKSTLLNALTGESILPVGIVALTAAPTFIRFGASPKISIRCQGDRPADEFTGASTSGRSACLAGFVTEKGNPQNRRGIAEVQVDRPAPILSGGVVLIDTPGIGSTYRYNTTATLNFLQQCDAALFLVSADPPITEVELEFLRHVKQKVPLLFFVLNKIDYLDEGELEEALSFYKRILAEEVGWNSEFPVFCVSARKGLEAKAAQDSSEETASGMNQLESFLVGYLARKKFNALLEAVSRRALEFIEAVLMEAGLVRQALMLPRGNLTISIAGFARRTQERLDETVAATKGAMAAAHARRQTHNGSVESEVIRMGDCLATLAQLKTDFTILRSGAFPANGPRAT